MTPDPTGSRSTTEVRRYRYELPACAASVPVSRHRAVRQLASWALTGDLCDSVALLISELVTNAVLHSASETIACELRDDGQRLHLEVHDEGGGHSFARSRRAPQDECGRGLLLVGALSAAWGIRDTAHGTRVVWAQVPHTPGLG